MYFFALDLESALAASAAVPDCDDDVLGFDLAARLVICKAVSLFILKITPIDKMNCTARFGNCVLRGSLMYQPCCLVLYCQGNS